MMEPFGRTGNKKEIAAFDFDGTLIKGDSFPDFARMVAGTWRLLLAMAMESPRLVVWKLGVLRGGDVKQRIFSRLYKGMPLERFREFGRRYAARAAARERADIVARLDAHVAAGHEVCIVTASVTDWVRPWAMRHGVSIKVTGTEPEIDANGCLTGRFATANCRGDEKVRRLKEIYGSDRETLYITAYGDSSGDDAMLAYADKGVRV